MLKSLHLAWSLIRIPHLALSLFLFPLIASLVLVLGQLLVTGLPVRASTQVSDETAVRARVADETNIVRRVIYGDGSPRPPVRVCRWQRGVGGEADREPTEGPCVPDQLDLALQVPNPETFDTSRYESLFNGHVDRIHVCRECTPSVVIRVSGTGDVSAGAYSPFGLAILSLPYTDREIAEQRVKIFRRREEIRDLLGPISFHAPEVPEGFGLDSMRTSLPLTINVTLLMVIALWLALKAHRKVLDYFSHNNVLLPLVAATGKNTFYSALWMLTGLRVGCFLFASIPLMYFGLKDVVGDKAFVSLPVTLLHGGIWMIALASTLGLATIVASISELKHRQSVFNYGYRYIPILLAIVGAAVWALSYLFVSPASGHLRMAISALPVVGMTPIFIAPAIKLPMWVLAAHALFSIVILWATLKHNARWFAAHLEEV